MIRKKELLTRIQNLESRMNSAHDRAIELEAKELLRSQKEGQRFRAVENLATCIEMQEDRLKMLERSIDVLDVLLDKLGLSIKRRADHPEIEIITKDTDGRAGKK